MIERPCVFCGAEAHGLYGPNRTPKCGEHCLLDDPAEAKRLAESAIDAPWTVRPNDDETVVVDGNGMWVAIVGLDPASAAFIAAARTLVPQLVAEVERLTKERDGARRSFADALGSGSPYAAADIYYRDAESRTAETIAAWLDARAGEHNDSTAVCARGFAASIREGRWRR